MQMKSCASHPGLSAAVFLSEAAALLCPEKMCPLFLYLQVFWKKGKTQQPELLALHESMVPLTFSQYCGMVIHKKA